MAGVGGGRVTKMTKEEVVSRQRERSGRRCEQRIKCQLLFPIARLVGWSCHTPSCSTASGLNHSPSSLSISLSLTPYSETSSSGPGCCSCEFIDHMTACLPLVRERGGGRRLTMMWHTTRSRSVVRGPGEGRERKGGGRRGGRGGEVHSRSGSPGASNE
jgi:hypothetical protein